jgi:hypothetical protein
MTAVNAASMKQQTINLNRHPSVLEEKKKHAKRELVMYSML